MKMGTLFDLVSDTEDLLDYFDEVGTAEQMVSRLERLKKRDVEELLDTVESLRYSVGALREETLESAISPNDDDDEPESLASGLSEKELEDLLHDDGETQKDDSAENDKSEKSETPTP
jgi:spore cortex formation protein SpoVR/YcgB (stage V sporulation)